MSAMVKLKPATHAKLQEIAREQHRPMGDVITELIERYEALLFDAYAESLAFSYGDSFRVLLKLRSPDVQCWNNSLGLTADVLKCFERLRYLFHGNQCVNRQRTFAAPHICSRLRGTPRKRLARR